MSALELRICIYHMPRTTPLGHATNSDLQAAASASPGECEGQRISGPPQTFPKESLSDLYAHLNLRSNDLEQGGKLFQ